MGPGMESMPKRVNTTKLLRLAGTCTASPRKRKASSVAAWTDGQKLEPVRPCNHAEGLDCTLKAMGMISRLDGGREGT